MPIEYGPRIVTDGLVLALDAADINSFDEYENLLTYSEQFDNANWAKQNGFSITANTAIAPDGTLTADTASRVNLASEFLFQSYGAAGTFTLSCWVRAVTGTTTFVMSAYNGVDSITASQTFTATTTWQRFSYTTTVSVGTNWYPCIPSVSGAQLYIWGAQLERGSSSNNYYPTTGTTKTRGSTWIDLTGNGNNGTLTNGPNYNISNGGSIVFDGVDDYIPLTSTITAKTILSFVRVTAVGGDNVVYGLDANGADNWFGINNSKVYFFGTEISDVNNFDLSGTTTILTNTWYQIGCSIEGSIAKVFLNGIEENSVIKSFTIGPWSGNPTIGRRGSLSQRYFPGNIANLQVYNRVLTANEISQNFNTLRGRFGI